MYNIFKTEGIYSTMKLYNTLTHKKEEFVPLQKGKINMYACGITVSGDAHIGHAIQAMIYDIMRRYFEYKGYQVTYARNYTDVDDKIIARAHEVHVDPMEYANQKIQSIDADMDALGVRRPDMELRATQHIPDIIAMTKGLIEKGFAYATPEGDVYFSVEKDPKYGKLSNRKVEDMLTGVRIDSEQNKHNPLDFALWKKAKAGEISWDSPWGKGRPGWHIECSAMNLAHFGSTVDIHGGGRDLIFPHHENEIAQSECLTGKPFVRYWTHNGLVKVNGQKMSKSLGNSILLHDLLQEYDKEVIRFALLQTNYKNDINITDDLFPKAKQHLINFYTILQKIEDSHYVVTGENESMIKEFEAAMDDDLNTAVVIANVFTYFKKMQEKYQKQDPTVANDIATMKKLYAILGLFQENPADFLSRQVSQDIPEKVQQLAKDRWLAKQAKDWSKADAIRQEIAQLGYSILDQKDGYQIEKK